MGNNATPPKHIVSAAVIVSSSEGEVLLIRTPLRGWEMPDGQVEEGESIFDAAKREVKEETGAQIEGLSFCGIFQNRQRSITNLLFTGLQTGGVLRTSEESLEVGYFPVNAALRMVSWPTFRERITLCLDKSTHPFCVVY